jgi:two-component system, cell cycle sensor histidine kinase and response regulator CckA
VQPVRAETIEEARTRLGRATLVILSGPQAGRRCTLPERAVFGRSADSPIILEDSGVSRRHAEIRRCADGQWEVEDLKSQNGTRVNGFPIERAALTVGDKLQFGPNILMLFTDRSGVEDELLERQKFELLGRLAVGIAHDFNNVLGVLAANAAYLRSVLESRSPISPDLASSVYDNDAAIANGARLASRLVGFARGAEESRAAVDLSRICTEVGQLCRRLVSAAVEIEIDVADGLSVIANEGEIEQIFMNLCVNARDAMPTGGRLSIRAKERALSTPEAARFGIAGRCLVIRIEDTGSGIDPRHMKKIFEPFFTTKPSGAGFGVGLATVKELVTLHGGAIDVSSSVGKGTCFTVVLPAHDVGTGAKRNETQHGLSIPPLTGEGRRVLLVDDDPLVRRSTRRLLSRLGFDVEEVSGGRAAIDCYEQGPRPFFVMLDLEMPELDGIDVLAALKAIDPTAAILVASGHRDAAKAHEVKSLGGWFLGKPFNAQDLARAIDILRNLEDPEIETRRHKLLKV